MKMAFILVSLCMVLSVSTLTAVAAPNPQVPSQSVKLHIAIFTFNCQRFSEPVAYSIRPMDSYGVYHPATPMKDADGLYHITLDVPPGHYQIFLDASPSTNAKTQDLPACETQMWFTVLAAHDRHLVAVLGQVFTPHSNCSVAGSLPAEGLGVQFVLPKGHMELDTVVGGIMGPANDDEFYPVDVDGSAYYVEHVSAEDYELRIGSAAIPVDLTKVFDNKSPYCQGQAVHDVTPHDLRDAFPPLFETE